MTGVFVAIGYALAIVVGIGLVAVLSATVALIIKELWKALKKPPKGPSDPGA